MKKLVLAAAIVCVAAMSQAASVVWTVSGAKAQVDAKVYLLTSIASTYTSLAKFEEAAVDSATIAKVGMAYKTTPKTATADAITSTANYYLAVVNGNTINYLDVTSDTQGLVYTPPASSAGTLSKTYAAITGSGTTAEIKNIPEPTSGLLLLLGMAGLALRRRRA